ncbi:MAG: electron transport complex subunit RsxG [Sinobacterium sp.]|jgi:electron transport complex protein RnfG
MLGKAISKNSIALGLFAIATTAMIASTFLNTKDRIAEQERIAQAKALLEVISVERHNNSMLDDNLAIGPEPELGLKSEQKIFIARNDSELVGFIFPAVAPDGYSGNIKLIVGVYVDGSVAGVRVLGHNETPGLGDKVDLKISDWILSFNGKSLGNPVAELWKVKKDKGIFDQFTGATITPRAVTNAVYKILNYYAVHKTQILAASKAQQTTGDADTNSPDMSSSDVGDAEAINNGG